MEWKVGVNVQCYLSKDSFEIVWRAQTSIEGSQDEGCNYLSERLEYSSRLFSCAIQEFKELS